MKKLLNLTVISLLISGCGGGGGGEGAAGPTTNPVILSAACASAMSSGFAKDIESTTSDTGGNDGSGGGAAAGGGLGKVLGALMTITDLSNGNVMGSATTDASTGLVTVKTCGATGPFLLEMAGKAGAKYFDEGLNALVDFPATAKPLHALVDNWAEHVGVSPLTEAAYRYALNNFKGNPAAIASGSSPLLVVGDLTGITAAQVAQANNVVLSQINEKFTTNYQMASAKTLPKPIDAGSSATALTDTRYGRSAAVNGGLVKAAAFYNNNLATPALSMVDQLARDLTDGRIDGFALDGTQVASSEQTAYNSTRLANGAQIATNVLAGQYGQVLKPIASQVDEFQYLIVQDISLTNLYLPDGSSRPQASKNNCANFNDEVALMSDGSVTIRRSAPTQNAAGQCAVPYVTTKTNNFLTDVKQIATGASTGYAVKRDGSVWAWGFNYCGTVIPGSTATAVISTPVRINGLSNITSIGAGAGGVLARDTSGRVFAWGTNGQARVLNITVPGAAVPPAGSKVCEYVRSNPGTSGYFTTEMAYNGVTQLATLQGISKVFTNGDSYFALTSDGRVYAWGSGEFGVLANGIVYPAGATYASYVNGNAIVSPQLISNLTDVIDLVVSQTTVVALLRDGSLKAWGNDNNYHIGSGVSAPTARPTILAGVTGVKALVGSSPFYNVDIGLLRTDGTAQTWSSSAVPYKRTTFTAPSPVRAISGGVEIDLYLTNGELRGANYFVGTVGIDRTQQYR